MTVVETGHRHAEGQRLTRITAIDDPAFERAYAPLWAYFGQKHEMEQRSTLAARFQLAPTARYELLLLENANGDWQAVSDYTLMPLPEGRDIAVHLSHTIVARKAEGSGLAKALMLEVAARCAELYPGVPVTMLAECEHDDGLDRMQALRLRIFESIGLVKADPSQIDYHQPDFQDPEDPALATPLQLQLLLYRVDREQERTIGATELKRLVMQLYWMYGQQFRAANMAHPALALDRWPTDGEAVALLPPTAPSARR